jgi:CheY-like chemotaxis protein
MAKAIKSVIIVENSQEWAELIVSVLEKKGYQTAWFVRANLVGNDIVLTAIDGKLTTLDASQFDVALVDGRLDQFSLDGPTLTPHLVAAGLRVIGISGAPSLNQAMVEGGASGSHLKHDLFTDMHQGKITLESLLSRG